MSAYCLIFHRTTPRTDTLLEPAPERIRWQGPDGLHHYQDTRLEILYAHHATTSPATKETLPLTLSLIHI